MSSFERGLPAQAGIKGVKLTSPPSKGGQNPPDPLFERGYKGKLF